MTDESPRTGLLQELLRDATVDWISESDIAGRILFDLAGSPSDRRTLSLGLIAEALLGNFMIAGSLNEQGFVPWPEDPESSFLKIARTWLELDPLEVYPGDVCWLSNTAQGHAIGQAHNNLRLERPRPANRAHRSDNLRTGLLQELLREGIDDWISEADIAERIFFDLVGSPGDRRAVALGLIAEALLGGFMIAGSLGDQGFVPWPEDPGSSFLKIARTWLGLDPLEVYPGKLCWLCNTAEGDAVGRAT